MLTFSSTSTFLQVYDIFSRVLLVYCFLSIFLLLNFEGDHLYFFKLMIHNFQGIGADPWSKVAHTAWYPDTRGCSLYHVPRVTVQEL